MREFQHVLVDSYGPEGAKMVWQNTHAVLTQECAYLKPATSSPPRQFVRVKDEQCVYGG